MISACAARGGSKAWIYWNEARAEAAGEAWRRAAAHAQRGGGSASAQRDPDLDRVLALVRADAGSEGIRRCEAMREEVRESPESDAAILRQLAVSRDCWPLRARPRAACDEQRHLRRPRPHALRRVLPERSRRRATRRQPRCGRVERCVTAYRALEEMGERAFRSTMAASLAERFSNKGATRRPMILLRSAPSWPRAATCSDADPLARRSCAGASEAGSDPGGRGARARGLGDRRNDRLLNHRADALVDLSHVLEASRRCDDAVAAASGALHLYELKGNVVAAAATQLRLGELVKM